MIERKAFLQTLQRVEAALSTRDLIPVFACFCFDGHQLVAWDDVVALCFPFVTTFMGAIRGQPLLTFLASSKAKELKITPEENSVLIKAGRSKFESALLPTKDFLFQQPEDEKTGHSLKVNQEFLQALSRVSISMSHDPSDEAFYGVTVVASNNGAFGFYASDHKTVSYATIGEPGDKRNEHILPPRFVELLLQISKTDAPRKISLTDTFALATFASGLKLYSRMAFGADAKRYREVVGSFSQKKDKKVEVPKSLAHCLERAIIPLAFMREPYTSIKVSNNKMFLHTKSPACEVKDSMPFEHDDVEVMIEPGTLQKVLPQVEKMNIYPEGLRMVGRQYTCLISTVTEKANSEE